MRLHNAPHSLSSSSAPPLHPPLFSALPLSPCAVHHNGEGQDAALEHAKKATSTVKGKKTAQGTSSRSGLPPGWIQGDWIRSTVERDDLEKLVEDGLIPDKSWRLPEGESEPQPREDERVSSPPVSTEVFPFLRTHSLGVS